MTIRIMVSVAALAAVLAGPAVADDAHPYDAATRSAIQAVISRQLAAFKAGDAATAESFAIPALKTKFPDPAAFLAMVKTGYGALVGPRSTTFGETTDSPHGPLQEVTVIAADGTVWKAVYSFSKVDGQWKISGCGLEEDKDQQAI